jgi:alkanesulfonate monooxygenase SsuD/methylene tetrahydromethanopterin reductase-like flavin-dependent oxidoreductase (luciferase family)
VFSADVTRPLAVAARARGFDAVFAADHVFPPGRPDRSAVEAFSLLANVAAAHPGLGVGVLVTRASMRPAGILAKLAAGLDHVSGGRAVVGLGLGDALGRPEHEALGLPYPPLQERADVLEETCHALRALFSGRAWQGGRYVPPLEGPILPPAAPPVWVGGVSDRAVGIAARAADAWNGWGLSHEAFAERARLLIRLTEDAGRDPASVEATWGGLTLVGRDRTELTALERERDRAGRPMDIWRGTLDDLRAFRDALAAAGCTWLIAGPVGPDDRAETIAEALAA